MKAAVRSDDSVYRYGGEEFLIVLGVVPGGVREAAERVRVAIEGLGLISSIKSAVWIVTIECGGGQDHPIGQEPCRCTVV